MKPMSADELEARLRAAELSRPGLGLEAAIRRGQAVQARREWGTLARLAAVALFVWVLDLAAGFAVDKSLAGFHHSRGADVVARAGPQEPPASGALAVVWQRRWLEQMACEDWMPLEPNPQVGGLKDRDPAGRRGSAEPSATRRTSWRHGGRAYV